MKLLYSAVLAAVVLSGAPADHAENRILVYTHNGKGYVHDNIATSVEAIKELGRENGFEVDSSDDPAVFTTGNLAKYKALVFSNSNNEAFYTEAQRDAFRKYIQSGGGLVGIHVATGSERNWPYFHQVLGGKFLRHPKLQKFTVRVQDKNFPATRNLPSTFEWEDECYYHVDLNPDLKILLVTDPAKIEDPKKAEYPGDRFGDALPLSWYHTYDGGREYYTALGHRKEHYADPLLRQQILGGILWAMGLAK
jgi:type 1 glutamine amidotransferase